MEGSFAARESEGNSIVATLEGSSSTILSWILGSDFHRDAGEALGTVAFLTGSVSSTESEVLGGPLSLEARED